LPGKSYLSIIFRSSGIDLAGMAPAYDFSGTLAKNELTGLKILPDIKKEYDIRPVYMLELD